MNGVTGHSVNTGSPRALDKVAGPMGGGTETMGACGRQPHLGSGALVGSIFQQILYNIDVVLLGGHIQRSEAILRTDNKKRHRQSSMTFKPGKRTGQGKSECWEATSEMLTHSIPSH